MSEFFTLALSKNVIFEKIGLFTSYLAGKRAADAAEFDRLAVSEPDTRLFYLFIEDAADSLAASLGDAVVSVGCDDDIIRIVLRNPHVIIDGVASAGADSPDFNSSARMLYSLVESYVVAVSIAGWLELAGELLSSGDRISLQCSRAVAEEKLSLIRNALATRQKPRTSRASRRRIPPI